MTIVADLADPVGLHSDSLLFLVGTSEAIQVINNAGWVAGDCEGFVIFNCSIGLDIDNYIFFQRCCSN